MEANVFRGRTSTGGVLFLDWFISGERSMAIALPFVNGDVERAMATAEQFVGDLRPLLPRHLVEGRRAEPRERAR
jgi:hypothetical protein